MRHRAAHRAPVGGFDISGPNPAGWYWSATPYDIYYDMYVAWCQRFSDGAQHRNYKGFRSSMRLVRTEAPKVT